jgi:cytochrome c5
MALVATLWGLDGCAGESPSPDAASPVPSAELERARAIRPWATATDLREGRTAYRESCGGCHRLHAPESRTLAAWETVLDTMAPKAGLDSTGRRKLTDWLASRAAAAPAPR